jgi:hypothetical protein
MLDEIGGRRLKAILKEEHICGVGFCWQYMIVFLTQNLHFSLIKLCSIRACILMFRTVVLEQYYSETDFSCALSQSEDWCMVYHYSYMNSRFHFFETVHISMSVTFFGPFLRALLPSFLWCDRPKSGLGLLIFEVSRSCSMASCVCDQLVTLKALQKKEIHWYCMQGGMTAHIVFIPLTS